MIPDEPQTDTISKVMPRRMIVAGAFMLIGFCAVVARLYFLQVVRHEKTMEVVRDLHSQQRVLPAHRGAILDSRGDLLAHDKIAYDVFLDSLQLRDAAAVRIRLARLEGTTVRDLMRKVSNEQVIVRYRRHISQVLGRLVREADGPPEMSPNEIAVMLADEKRAEVPLMRGLGDEASERWQKWIEENDLLGVSLRTVTRRAYPCAERLAHVLGHVNFENKGQSGIEATFDKILGGTDGHQQIERDRRGREILTRRGETVEPQNGADVHLTIDMQLQEIMEDTLEQAVKLYDPRKIISILVDPRTGAIRAMASRLHRDREEAEGTINLPIGSVYEPGSVFKVITYAGMFDRGLYGLSDSVNCDPDQRVFANLNIHDHVSGSVTIAQAFAQSSNRAAFLMAHRLGEEKFTGYAQAFGLGQKTGVELTGEVSGRIITRGSRDWNPLTLSRMAIGHSVSVTPLQMVMAVAAVANNGMMMKPQIVQEVRDERGKVLRSLKPEEVRRVCSERAAANLRIAMEGVVSDKGTGAKAAIPGWRVAGKTGTAQLYKKKGNKVVIDDGHYCVSFAGFAPADKPELCAIVIVDDPHGPKEELLGGILAGPIFAQLMKQCLEHEAAARRSLAEGGAR